MSVVVSYFSSIGTCTDRIKVLYHFPSNLRYNSGLQIRVSQFVSGIKHYGVTNFYAAVVLPSSSCSVLISIQMYSSGMTACVEAPAFIFRSVLIGGKVS